MGLAAYLGEGDRRAVAALVAVPVVVFVLPALAGHPAIVGDNLLQNFPLRVLTGRQLDAGHWPVWNPYADSGTPLLGGMNAGSMYPGTLLFAVLPGIVAWVANLLVVYWAAALGLFVLARRLGAGPTAAGLAAATYAFSGAMVGQLVHLGVVQGQAWLPWLVVCQLALGRAVLSRGRGEPLGATVRAALPATTGLAACIGLVCLTGEPRSMADAGVVVGVVGLVELVAHSGTQVATRLGRLAYVVATAIGAAWGIAIGAVQLAPGVGFISLTRRAHVSYAFFSMGAWPTRWLALLLVPGALGDNGVAATPRFFASYNLPEVTGAVGLAAMTAVFAAVARLCSRRRGPETRGLWAFVALCVVGVLLAVAPATRLGVLLYHVPFLSSTRLQSRSIAIFDLGATVLLAGWLDALFRGRRDEAGLVGPRRIVTLAPLWATVVVCALALADPRVVTETLLGAHASAHVAAGIRTSVAVTLAIAVAYLVALHPRREGRGAVTSRALVVVVLVELVCFNALFETALVTGIPTVEPSARVAAAALGHAGRTALVDPGVVAYHETAPLGLANLNVFTRLPSVQGYGSLHAARYTDATGTTRLGELDGCALARGVFAPLRLASLAVAATGFQAAAAAGRMPTTCGPVRARDAVTRYFGGRLAVARLSFLETRTAHLADRATVRLLGATGQVLAAAPAHRSGRALVATFPSHPRAIAAVLAAPRGMAVASTTLTTAARATLRLDTALQVALDDPTSWRLVGLHGTLTLFRATRVAAPVWLVHPARGATARLVAAGVDGSASVAVSTPVAARLVRSEAWLPGWGATLVGAAGSSSRPATVVPLGLVQSVVVPEGRWTVEFAYHAPHLREGLVASGVAILALLAALFVLARTRRRGRGSPNEVR